MADDKPKPKLIANKLGNPTSLPVTPEQVQWARCRPIKQRTALPKVGQLVWYRHEHLGTVVEAEVYKVDGSNRGDYNVWRFKVDQFGVPVEDALGQRVMEMVEDPWPDVYVKTPWGNFVTREARIPGSAGWLPKGGK